MLTWVGIIGCVGAAGSEEECGTQGAAGTAGMKGIYGAAGDMVCGTIVAGRPDGRQGPGGLTGRGTDAGRST